MERPGKQAETDKNEQLFTVPIRFKRQNYDVVIRPDKNGGPGEVIGIQLQTSPEEEE